MQASLQRRRARCYLLGALLSSALITIIIAACGVSLDAGEEGTETFNRLSIAGDFRAGGSLSLTLEYQLQYPVTVLVACHVLAPRPLATPTPKPTPTLPPELETVLPALPSLTPRIAPTVIHIPMAKPTSTRKVAEILTEQLPPNPEGGPVGEATPVLGTIERDFTAPDQPGRYTVRCFTPADENNRIDEKITIAPSAASPP